MRTKHSQIIVRSTDSNVSAVRCAWRRRRFRHKHHLRCVRPNAKFNSRIDERLRENSSSFRSRNRIITNYKWPMNWPRFHGDQYVVYVDFINFAVGHESLHASRRHWMSRESIFSRRQRPPVGTPSKRSTNRQIKHLLILNGRRTPFVAASAFLTPLCSNIQWHRHRYYPLNQFQIENGSIVIIYDSLAISVTFVGPRIVHVCALRRVNATKPIFHFFSIFLLARHPVAIFIRIRIHDLWLRSGYRRRFYWSDSRNADDTNGP